MSDPVEGDQEDELRQLEQAVKHLKAGDLKRAAALLDGILAHAPAEYQRVEERDGELYIRYWDQEEFVYDVMRRKENGDADRSIYWMPSLYPKAFYYRGFLAVKDRRYEEALPYLDAGLKLDSEAPLLRLERGKALSSLHRNEEALDEYRAVADRGDDIAPTPRAVAWRGVGFQRIELKRLDEAEAAFHTSLKIDPGNEIALSEWEYIKHLRQGGPQTFTLSTEVTSASPERCTRCGKTLEMAGGGQVFPIDGKLLFLCSGCADKLEDRRAK